MSERCRMYDEQISAYLDGELSEAEAARLRAHAAECDDCADLLDLLSGLSQALRDDQAEPPGSLAAGVMDRIGAWEFDHPTRQTRYAPEPIPISSARKTRHAGRNFAVAACLILALGAGAFYGMSRSWRESTARNMDAVTLDAGRAEEQAAEAEVKESMTFGADTESADALTAGADMAEDADNDVRESDAWQADLWQEDVWQDEAEREEVTLDNGPMLFAAPAEEPAPQAESGNYDAAPAPEPEPEAPAWREEPMEEAAQEQAAEPAPAVGGGTVSHTQTTYAGPRFTCDHPAHVDAGKESDFEALLHSSATPGDVNEDDLTSIAAVEYNGVIYEFFLDEDTDQLFWKDAAESVFPLPADGTEDDLWDIIG